MRITVLSDNRPAGNGLRTEHGFSCLIEHGGAKLIFDTGNSDIFLQNAAVMGLDLSDVRTVALSHAHMDHSGGLRAIVRQWPGKDYTVYLHQNFFTPKYWDQGASSQYVGNAFTQEYINDNNIRCAMLKTGTFTLDEEGKNNLISGIGRRCGFEHIDPTARAMIAGEMIQDDFREEIAYVAKTARGLVVVSGCSHSGIANICEEAVARFKQPVCAVLAGTHLVAALPDQIADTIDYFNGHAQIHTVAPVHCTGDLAFEAFEQNCKAYARAGAGTVFNFDD